MYGIDSEIAGAPVESYGPEPRSKELSGFFMAVHFALFLCLILFFAMQNIAGKTEGILISRQIVYTFYVLFIFAVAGLAIKEMTRLDIVYMMCALGVSSAVVITDIFIREPRFIDHFAAGSFFIGVYVFSMVLPRAFAGHGERIMGVTVVTVAVIVCIAYHLHAAQSGAMRNTLSAYAGGGTLILTVSAFRKGISFPLRVFCFALAIAMAVVMVLALGRVAIVACAATLIIFFWLGSGRRGKILLVMLLVLAVLFFLSTGPGASLFDAFLHKSRDTIKFPLRTLSGRTDIWEKALRNTDGILWFGKGKLWFLFNTGGAAHSSYIELYFAYGILALSLWLIMCGIGLWAAVKALRMRKGTGRPPVAALFVSYFLILSMAESYFSVMFEGFGVLFYLGIGMCLFEIRRLQQARQLEWDEQQYEQWSPDGATY